MEKLTFEQVNNFTKEELVSLFMETQEQLLKSIEQHEALQHQLNKDSDAMKQMSIQIEKLTEQIMLMNSRQFGKKSERYLTSSEQLTMLDFGFNEAEATIQGQLINEPDINTVIVPEHKRRKRTGKREEDLSGFPVTIVEHNLSEEELQEKFPKGYDRLPDEVYKKLELHPATFEVKEHHIAVYKGRNGEIAKAKHPKEMLNNSIATPSLVAAVINGKYVNAVPLYRQEQEYKRNDVNISRQVMANWVITTAERYISLVYDRIKKDLLNSPVIHADETPVTVVRDGREGIHKSYMWVYRTGDRCKAVTAILYDYQKTRKAEAPKEFLKDFSGKLVCDGYQVYHTLEKQDDVNFTVAGCWTHARRPFAEIVKSLGEDKAHGTVAYEALVQIQNIYHTDNALQKLPPSARKKKRKVLVKPLVDGFFEWIKASYMTIPPNSATAKGLQYCLNQEKYLRVFLSDPELPLDNNIAEQAIRPFCVGKKNWNIIDTLNGAEASAILYSIVETAKANNLNIYEYLKHLLTEIPKHMDEHNQDFLEEMLPWSRCLPEQCRKKKVD